jgi:hypothetical protein
MLRPQMHLIAAGRLYPKAWCQADQFRADRGKGTLPTWPSWCYLPMAAWYAIVSGGKGRLGLDRIGHVGQLAALGSWRANLHWLPPIPVNVEDFSDLPAVVRPVEPDLSPN